MPGTSGFTSMLKRIPGKARSTSRREGMRTPWPRKGKVRPPSRVKRVAGVQALQLGERVVRDGTHAVGAALQGGVVGHHQLAVAGEVDVRLQHLGAVALHRHAEGGQGVLRREQRAPPVGDVQGGGQAAEEGVLGQGHQISPMYHGGSRPFLAGPRDPPV